jgi:hypothetical protein
MKIATGGFFAVLCIALALSCDYGDLDNVPAGFADGVDNELAFEAPGSDIGVATTAARSDHAHSLDYVAKTGDTMTGMLTAEAGITTTSVTYLTPRTHYLAVGGEAFVPRSGIDYFNGGGNGGAYIPTGADVLRAPVYLPHGAAITGMTAHFYDDSTSNIDVSLAANSFAGNYFALSSADSTGVSTYGSKAGSAVDYTVDNTAFSYAVSAYCAAWDSNNTRVMAVVITYTVSEAQ